MKTYANYADAREAAERIVRELANGSQAADLTGEQSRNAIAALQRLEDFRQATGRRFSILAAVAEFVGTVGKLKRHSLGEAVKGYRRPRTRHVARRWHWHRLDRLCMMPLGQESIRDVILFPQFRPKWFEQI